LNWKTGELKRYIPSLFTAGNLCCGFLAIIVSDFFLSSILLLIGLTFDALDGFIARALKVQSEFGKELDSLADMVSFGIAPAFFYALLSPSDHWTYYMPPLYFVIGAACRLAVFNTKESASYFSGLPTPAAAMFMIGLILGVHFEEDLYLSLLRNDIIYHLIPLVLMLLMLSSLRMFSLKSLNKGLKYNMLPILTGLLFIILVIYNYKIALSITILAYIFFSIFENLIRNKE
jgi:CDP-diacylglycerol--serine O-phosphatidyltransferase